MNFSKSSPPQPLAPSIPLPSPCLATPHLSAASIHPEARDEIVLLNLRDKKLTISVIGGYHCV